MAKQIKRTVVTRFLEVNRGKNYVNNLLTHCRTVAGIMINEIDNSPRIIGYARVSTEDQDLDLQIDALLQHGVKREHIFCDKISGSNVERPGLARCQEVLRSGDTLMVWRLDRLGRSMVHLVSVIEDLNERGIGFRSVCDGVIDTTSASGELIFNIFSALAQFERRLIQERTRAGLAAARARGRIGGRPATSKNDPKVVMANKLFLDKSNSVDDICTTLKISRTTLYRYAAICGNRDARSLPKEWISLFKTSAKELSFNSSRYLHYVITSLLTNLRF